LSSLLLLDICSDVLAEITVNSDGNACAVDLIAIGRALASSVAPVLAAPL
jgi:hypothetical protein